MPQRNSQPLKWQPRGLSDTLDTSNVFEGAMTLLQNLIPAPSTQGLWQCRPAAQLRFDFNSSGFSGGFSSGFRATNYADISAILIIGDVVYGMIASIIAFPGKDVPFAFNLLTNTLTTVTGMATGNLPNTLPAWTPPATPTAWVPPTMALVGSKIIVTHQGFTMLTGPVGQIDITNPAAPAWSVFNLTGAAAQPFTVVPTWVQQFNGRAYYIHNLLSQPAVFFSDALAPSTMTNANQILTFNDQEQLTAMGPLQLNNQLGGIVQSLMVFKGTANIFQITGDYALNSLSVNALNVATGTLAPNSITATPKGLAFMAPDGYRLIDFQATVSDPIGLDGTGITMPFINAVVPSRVSAMCNGSMFRTTVQNGNKPGAPIEEYWYRVTYGWNGPQLFPINSTTMTAPSLGQAYSGGNPVVNTFICTYAGVPGTLWQSDYVQNTTSTFVENGIQMQWLWQTPNLPSAEQMGNIAMTETTVMIAFGVGTTIINALALSPMGTVITQAVLTSQQQSAIWGQFTWGGAVWGSSISPLSDRPIAWPIPIVTTRFTIQLQGNSSQNIKVGTMRLRYQPLQQLLTPGAGVA